ncbi:peptidylprolyl isomerase [Martelella alba]|uniref:Parvulin-like PPIase n=1 Tax=Martelella alba TaxID=2590451 RepID=A0A506UAG8_9HYPH|nr:peptidylprolyl isomerase [Martelella alba]TPW30064.1 peptidylprolyl isomerase [Martelella alba]
MQKRYLVAAALLATTVGFGLPTFAQDAAQPATDATPAPAADASAAAPAPAPETVIATVNGQDVHQSELDAAIAEFKGQVGNMPAEQLKALALSSLINMKLMAKAAEEEGLDKTDAFKARMAELRDQELYNEYFQAHVDAEVTDAMVKARYEKEIAAAPKQEEVKAAHILVQSEDEAKDIIKQLDDGADFAELAKEHSKDSNASDGGDLGYFSKGQMVPEFEKAAFALKPGQYTETPVKTQFGYHIIKVEDIRDKQPVPYEQVAPQVRQMVVRDKYMEAMDALKQGDTVVIEDKDLQKAYDDVNKQQQAQQ